MSATTPNVGVRVFSDLSGSTVAINARETYAGIALPMPNADNSIEMHKPFAVSTTDTDTIGLIGDGLARDAIAQIASEGIHTDIIMVRCPESADADNQLAEIAGDAANKTGAWALADAKSELGIEPGLLLSPSYTNARPGNAANPVVTAFDGVCEHIIDCMAVMDTPETSREDAVEAAADFAASLNVIAMYPSALVTLNSQNLTRALSPHLVGATLRRDAEAGSPYKAAWNKPLKGIRGGSQSVSYRDGDTQHDANYLNQRGVGTVIENKLLWAPYSTATDPTTVGYRSIKRIRTRRSIEKAMLRALRAFNASDLGPHLVTLVYESLAEACQERVNVGALIDYELVWDSGLNPDNLLRAGGLAVKLKFEETPDLTDLQIYSEPQPEAFEILRGRIATALQSIGNPNITVNQARAF
ncbi:MAG: phage tail sheath family protein [Pseudomonadota bacterium]